MSAVVDTLRRLAALATQGGTEGERRAAQKAYERLLARSGVHEDELHQDEVAEVEIAFKDDVDELLLGAIGYCLGLNLFEMRHVRTGRNRRCYLVQGDPRLVDLVKPLFKAHLKPFRQRVDGYAIGLAFTMFPAAPTERSTDHKPRSFTPEEIEAIRAGQQHGARVTIPRGMLPRAAQ